MALEKTMTVRARVAPHFKRRLKTFAARYSMTESQAVRILLEGAISKWTQGLNVSVNGRKVKA